MAGFQPLNFNYGIDPAMLQGSMSSMASYSAPAMPSVAVEGVPVASTSGNLFSNLFGDGGVGDGLFTRKSMFGGRDATTGMSTMGWAPAALGIGQALMGAFQGRQAMRLAEDQFKESRRQFDLNFNTQRQTMNTAMEDRQRARVASNPGAYDSVEDYMNKNRV